MPSSSNVVVPCCSSSSVYFTGTPPSEIHWKVGAFGADAKTSWNLQAVNVPVIGMGGITCAEDVLEFILVGAHAVQVGTYNFMRPDNAFRLVDEVRALAESLGIASWDDYRGTLKV